MDTPILNLNSLTTYIHIVHLAARQLRPQTHEKNEFEQSQMVSFQPSSLITAPFSESLRDIVKISDRRGMREATTENAMSYICPAAAFHQLFCRNVH